MSDKDNISARLRKHYDEMSYGENQQLSSDLYDAAELIDRLQHRLNEFIKEARKICKDLDYEIRNAEDIT